MVDLSLIAGTVSSLKAASDIAKGLVSIRDATLINEKIIELQRAILAAQSDAFAAQTGLLELHELNRDLEQRLAKAASWQAEAHRYELKKLPPGAFVYSLKADSAAGEPPHYLCPTCFGLQRKEILQSTGPSNGIETLHCNGCHAEIRHGISTIPGFAVCTF